MNNVRFDNLYFWQFSGFFFSYEFIFAAKSK